MIHIILGQTGAGKSTMINQLKSKGYTNVLTLTTTRPMRSGEIDGVDYHFCSRRKFKKLLKKGNLIAVFTAQNGWSYAIDKTKHDLNTNYIGILDPKSFKELKNHLGIGFVRGIYLDIPLETRAFRLINRDSNLNESSRRLLSDLVDFRQINEEVDYRITSSESIELIHRLINSDRRFLDELNKAAYS